MQDTEINAEKLAADLRIVIADAEALLRATANQAGETVASARAKVQDSLDSAKAKLEAFGDDATQQARAAVQAAEGYVRDNPWHALGVAALVGIALGLLISRR